jgi:hypothetical protein
MVFRTIHLAISVAIFLYSESNPTLVKQTKMDWTSELQERLRSLVYHNTLRTFFFTKLSEMLELLAFELPKEEPPK